MRGVRIPELHEQLFAAAERIMARDGAAGLTSRAITDEAGCAKGVLHNHFDGLDGFLAEFAVSRISRTMDRISGLPEQAGHGTVAGNLTDAAVTMFGSGTVQAAALIMARPALMNRVMAAFEAEGPAFGQLEAVFTAYLEAEQQLGRIPATADAGTLAFTLIGSVHHLFFTSGGTQPDPAQVRKIAVSLIGTGPAPT